MRGTLLLLVVLAGWLTLLVVTFRQHWDGGAILLTTVITLCLLQALRSRFVSRR